MPLSDDPGAEFPCDTGCFAKSACAATLGREVSFSSSCFSEKLAHKAEVSPGAERSLRVRLRHLFGRLHIGFEYWMIGMPELGLLGIYLGSGCPLAQAQAGVLVGPKESSELQVIVTGQAL